MRNGTSSMTSQTTEFKGAGGHQSLGLLSLAALGVVYGDIGTSPLYVMKTVFDPIHGLAVTDSNVIGIISLIFWTIMIVVSLGLLLMAVDGVIGRGEGLILLACSVGYTWLLIRISRRETAKIHSEYEQAYGQPEASDHGRWYIHVLLILCGLVLLVIGSEWLVNGAVSIASTLGVSELIISLTIIAAGTSLPEVATSIIAGLRGECL